jgi:hypothetical protein
LDLGQGKEFCCILREGDVFNAQEVAELKSKLAAIAKRPAHWSETKIGRWNGGLVGDALRFQEEDRWWTRDPRGVGDLGAVNALLENCGLGRMRSRDEFEVDPDFERERDLQKKKNETYESSTPVEEVVEAQSDKSVDEEEAWSSEYLPGDNDNALRWYSDLAKRVDVNTSDRRAWFSALGSYVNKFPASAVARDLDQSTLRTMVKMLCEEE